MDLLVPARSSETELREKGSRFLGLASRVAGEEQASARIRDAEREYEDASHVCFAWRLGSPDGWRAADAGEPHGTAGPPILDAIRERDLLETLVIVVRWFGGVKLGKGGLARAYRETARRALEAAGVEHVQELSRVEFRVGVAIAGKIPAAVARSGATVAGEEWDGEHVRFSVVVPRGDEDNLVDVLQDVTAGTVEILVP